MANYTLVLAVAALLVAGAALVLVLLQRKKSGYVGNSRLLSIADRLDGDGFAPFPVAPHHQPYHTPGTNIPQCRAYCSGMPNCDQNCQSRSLDTCIAFGGSLQECYDSMFPAPPS